MKEKYNYFFIALLLLFCQCTSSKSINHAIYIQTEVNNKIYYQEDIIQYCILKKDEYKSLINGSERYIKNYPNGSVEIIFSPRSIGSDEMILKIGGYFKDPKQYAKIKLRLLEKVLTSKGLELVKPIIIDQSIN